jgi:aerobic-type carbon monoxide dehydrogenase small subunit (CoxS/CutS family)
MELNINNQTYSVEADDSASLLTVLRDVLDLTGSKYGCGEGACGACTVLIDERPVRSCITTLQMAQGKSITTIEGLADGDKLTKVQKAFVEADVFQCAYCASGMIMSATALLKRIPKPSVVEIRNFMNGNICRCGTYPRIESAIQKASETVKR